MSTVSIKKSTYVICVRNDDYPASLERMKVYERIPDDLARKLNLVRVVDESGEDYLYPESCFLPIRLTEDVRRELAKRPASRRRDRSGARLTRKRPSSPRAVGRV